MNDTRYFIKGASIGEMLNYATLTHDGIGTIRATVLDDDEIKDAICIVVELNQKGMDLFGGMETTLFHIISGNKRICGAFVGGNAYEDFDDGISWMQEVRYDETNLAFMDGLTYGLNFGTIKSADHFIQHYGTEKDKLIHNLLDHWPASLPS